MRSYREVLICTLVALSYLFYFDLPETNLHTDGLGHYDYLRSVFIFEDFVRFNESYAENPDLYNRIDEVNFDYVDIGEYRVNKYPFGVSALLLPFFLTAYLLYSPFQENISGLEWPFQLSVGLGALVYLAMALILFRKLLVNLSISRNTISILQVLVVFATPLIYFSFQQAAFSHVYSFFAISGFICYISNFLSERKTSHALISAFFLGLVFAIRQMNIIVILALPILAMDVESLHKGIVAILGKIKVLIPAIILFLLFPAIQSLLYFLQTSQWWLDTYTNESFNFHDPAFTAVLFSFKKGLITYTPVLILPIIGAFRDLFKNNLFRSISWLVFFILITYLISSWWWWSNGASHGQRFFIDYYPILFIPLALMLKNLKGNVLYKVIVFFALLTIPLNMVQAYQYRYHIMDWENMTGDLYWKVFLRQDKILSGYCSRPEINTIDFEEVKTISFEQFEIPANTTQSIFMIPTAQIPNWSEISGVRIELSNEFYLDGNDKVYFCIGDTNHVGCDVYDECPLVHFSEGTFNEFQRGHADFKFQPITDGINRLVKFSIHSDKRNLTIRDVSVKFYRK